MRMHKSVWAHVAFNVAGIAKGDPRHWRVFIGEYGTPTPVLSCPLAGHAIPDINYKTESTPDGKPDKRGLRGWVSAFGTVCFTDDGHAVIQLEDPRPPDAP